MSEKLNVQSYSSALAFFPTMCIAITVQSSGIPVNNLEKKAWFN